MCCSDGEGTEGYRCLLLTAYCLMIVVVDDDGTVVCSTYDVGRSGICAIMKEGPCC